MGKYATTQIIKIALIFNLPIRMKAKAMRKATMYAKKGSLFFLNPFPKIPIPGYKLSLHKAWKIFGADTRQAKADERVAAKQPA